MYASDPLTSDFGSFDLQALVVGSRMEARARPSLLMEILSVDGTRYRSTVNPSPTTEPGLCCPAPQAYKYRPRLAVHTPLGYIGGVVSEVVCPGRCFASPSQPFNPSAHNLFSRNGTDMCGTESRKELPLAASASGCSCCSPAAAEESRTVSGDAEYSVEGLTCGHCVQSVQKAVTALAGVTAASVELNPGGLSRLVVSGSVADAAVRDAVVSAGYSLAAH